jgi:hypothetical protein
MDLGNFGRRE